MSNNFVFIKKKEPSPIEKAIQKKNLRKNFHRQNPRILAKPRPATQPACARLHQSPSSPRVPRSETSSCRRETASLSCRGYTILYQQGQRLYLGSSGRPETRSAAQKTRERARDKDLSRARRFLHRIHLSLSLCLS